MLVLTLTTAFLLTSGWAEGKESGPRSIFQGRVASPSSIKETIVQAPEGGQIFRPQENKVSSKGLRTNLKTGDQSTLLEQVRVNTFPNYPQRGAQDWESAFGLSGLSALAFLPQDEDYNDRDYYFESYEDYDGFAGGEDEDVEAPAKVTEISPRPFILPKTVNFTIQPSDPKVQPHLRVLDFSLKKIEDLELPKQKITNRRPPIPRFARPINIIRREPLRPDLIASPSTTKPRLLPSIRRAPTTFGPRMPRRPLQSRVPTSKQYPSPVPESKTSPEAVEFSFGSPGSLLDSAQLTKLKVTPPPPTVGVQPKRNSPVVQVKRQVSPRGQRPLGSSRDVIPILKQVANVQQDGDRRFNYQYEGGNGIRRSEEGFLRDPASENPVQVIQGSYSYPGPDGKVYTISYIADERGFRATGDHIPI